MKLVRHLANLGYGSRREILRLLADGRVTDIHGERLGARDAFDHDAVRVDGEPLDPAPGVVLMLHKPVDMVCSHADAGPLVYSLLPSRYRRRKPAMSSVGRLDRDTSGLLLMTDDGQLLHRIIAPRAHVAKVYEASLAEPLRGDEGDVFARGDLMLRSETRPLAPAQLAVLDTRHVRLTITEGRYHQVRRMFAAVGNRVEALRRVSVGGLSLGDLPCGEWRVLDADEVARIFAASP